MTGKTIIVVGASTLGCRYALAARAAGHNVTLIDEHPQPLSGMSLDAPYFYGPGLPASLADEAAMMDNVIGSNDLLMECAEAEVDLRIASVVWGAFHNSENRRSIQAPHIGIVSAEGNELMDYDQLVLATGSRDFVPSFQGWDLPGVMGVKAAEKLITAYQVFNGTRAVVLGATALAMEAIRAAQARGIEIAAVVEPNERADLPEVDLLWLRENGIPLLCQSLVLRANGQENLTSVTLCDPQSGEAGQEIAADTLIIAIGAMPNIELPAAMGCDLSYADALAAWMPVISGSLQTSVENVHWLSGFNEIEADDAIARILGALDGNSPAPLSPPQLTNRATYMRHWVERLHATGASDVILCQCESVTRAQLDGLQAPRYLKKENRSCHSPVTLGDAPMLEQDFIKRITRVGMGHCQGKRCRDEAAMVLAKRYGLNQAKIRPASYRFPVRPIDVALFTALDEDADTRDRWPHWLQPENH